MHSARNSPQVFHKNFSNIMDLSARLEHKASASGNPSPVSGNQRYGSRSPPTGKATRVSSKFVNQHNLMPAPQFLSKAREDALARQKAKEGAVGISQFLNTNFLKEKSEQSSSPSLRTTKLHNLIACRLFFLTLSLEKYGEEPPHTHDQLLLLELIVAA